MATDDVNQNKGTDILSLPFTQPLTQPTTNGHMKHHLSLSLSYTHKLARLSSQYTIGRWGGGASMVQ